MNRVTALIVLVMTLVVPLEAQPQEFRVVGTKEAPLVAVLAFDVPAYELIMQLATSLRLEVRCAGQALESLRTERVRVSVFQMAPSEFVEHVAGAVGLDGTIVEGTVQISNIPDVQDDAAADRARARAIASLERAALAKGATPEVPFGFRIGLLHLAGNDLSRGLAALRVFFQENPSHDLASRARVLAGESALTLRNHADARAILEGLEKHHHGVPEILEGQMLLARAYAATGAAAEAILRLNRIISDSKSSRQRMLASLQLAEIYFQEKSYESSIKILESFGEDARREHPDLAERVPFYLGLCLLMASRPRDAVPHLQLAALTLEGGEFRVRSAIALVRAYAELKDYSTALLAAESAKRLAPDPAKSREIHVLLGELYLSIGLPVLAASAFTTAQDISREADELGLRALSGLIAARFRETKFDQARELARELSLQEKFQSEARMIMIRCDMEQKLWRSALDGIDELLRLQEGPVSEEVARRRGECFLSLGDNVRASLAFQGMREIR